MRNSSTARSPTSASWRSLSQGGNFVDCVFIGCYFRKAELKSSSFIGCRFIDCNFNQVAVKASRFIYSTFSGCQIPFDELEPSLPPEPNLRADLARNLFLESTHLGLSSEARRYRTTEIKAREEHLRRAIRGSSDWYRTHYDTTARRLGAATSLLLSLCNRWLWGYGEQARVLVWNVLILALLAFPALYYVVSDGMAKPEGEPIEIWDFVRFSVATMLPGGIAPGLEALAFWPQLLATVEAVIGLVAVALFASYIFRWSLHR